MNLELYYATTTCALVPHVTLSEAGATFETRIVNLKISQHHSPEYLAINPLHKVPVLVIDGDPLTENVAIQIWIARAFPQAGLLPTDPRQEIKAISFMAWCASGIHPHLSRINSPAKFCDAPGAAESVRKLAGAEVQKALKVADERLSGQRYFFGEFTAPDAYFFWCFRRAAQLGVDVSDFSNCAAHFERVRERPSVQATLELERNVLLTHAAAAGTAASKPSAFAS